MRCVADQILRNFVFAALMIILFSCCKSVQADDPNLIGWWKMIGPTQGQSSRFVRDYSGNGHHGTMGSSDVWLEYGAIDFDGGSWGASGIVFENDGADIVANLTDQVTISYVATWDTVTTVNYPYDGKDSGGIRVLSSECPTENHIRDHKGGTDMWCWEAFNENDSRFIFGEDKTWGDFIKITTTVNFNTGDYKIYVDDQLYVSATGKSGSFSDLVSFTIGRTLWAEMEGAMYDFRLYDKELSQAEIIEMDEGYDDSLRAWYKFDETSGTEVFDSSGNDFHTTVNATAIWDNGGAVGGCLSNDTAWRNQWIAVPSQVFETIDQQATIAWWAKLTDLGGAESSGGWFSGKNTSGTNIASAKAYPDGDNYYVPYNAGGADNDWWWGYGNSTADNEWHHFALVFDAIGGTEKLYFDGEVVASSPTEAGDTMADMNSFNIFTRTSSETGGEWYDSFHGKMDDFRIYDRALETDEIKLMINPEDINLDNFVDLYDVELLFDEWLDDSKGGSDINKDGIVNFKDYGQLVNAWREPRRFYFDSINGNDAYSGRTSSSPWRSLGKFNATTFLPGDHIYFKAGRQWSGQLKPKGSGTEDEPITIDAYGDISDENNKPRFDGNGTVNPTLYIKNVEHWEFSNLQVTNLGATTAQWRRAVSVNADRFGQMDHIYLKDIYIHSVNGELSVFGGGNAINIGVVESTTEQSHLNNLLIEGCHFETVDNVAILGGGGYPTDKEGPQGTNIIIRNNYFEDIGGAAICLIGSDGALVEGNVVNGAILREANCAIWPFAADNTVVQYNEVYNCADNGDGEAYDADYQCDGTIFQYNYSHDNPGGFMRLCNGDPGAGHYNRNTIVRYNISVNDGKSDDALIELWKRLDNCQVYNNILYIPENRGTIDFVGSNMYGGGDGGSNYWWNNIFFAGSGTTGRFSVDDGSSNSWSNNCFYGSMKTGSVLGAFGVYWWSYSNGTPSDGAKITSNPMMANPGSHQVGDSLDGYKLQSGSPCIGAGKTINNNGGYDFWGNLLYNGNPDIGAEEN